MSKSPKKPLPSRLTETASDALSMAAIADVAWTAWPHGPSIEDGFGSILAKGLDSLARMVYGGGGLAEMAIIPCPDRKTAMKLAEKIRRQEAIAAATMSMRTEERGSRPFN